VESPPYRGVRGRGIATLNDDRGEEILRRLIERYLGDSSSRLASFLLARVEQGSPGGSISTHTQPELWARDRPRK
jgi:hypothetical protein